MEKLIPKQDQIVSLIVSLVDPDQIILFGSYARGEERKDSDIDLLVIKKGIKNPSGLSGNIYMAFYDHKINIPIDVIVVGYDEYLEKKDKLGYVYQDINREGKVLYGEL